MPKQKRNIDHIEGLIIDLDGTVYAGNKEIAGAIEAIMQVKTHKKVVYLSNRGNYTSEMCYTKLINLGLDVSQQEILLASTVTARFLVEHHSNDKVWVLGEKGLKQELLAHDVHVTDHPKQAQWVVITLNESLTYKDLNDAFRAVINGAKIIATNADKTFPRADGIAFDVGGIIAAIEATTGRKADVVIGKPSKHMANAALHVLDLPPEKCLVIGDSLSSDITLGQQHGMLTALVMTGTTNKTQLSHSSIQPDFIWDSITQLHSFFKK